MSRGSRHQTQIVWCLGVVAVMALWMASALWLDPLYVARLAAIRSLWDAMPGAAQVLLHNAHLSYYLGFLIVAGFGLVRGRRDLIVNAAAYACTQLLLSVLLLRVLKIGIGRPRPGVEGMWSPGALDSAHHSLPSGHATDVAVGFVSIVQSWRNTVLRIASTLPLGLTCADRLLEGVHYPSDVLAGLALGSVGTALILGRIKAMLARGFGSNHFGE